MYIMNYEKPHYKAVILVIANNQDEVFIEARKVWEKYIHSDPNYKVFFVYGMNYVERGDKTESDLVYKDVVESYPKEQWGKLLEAIKHTHDNFTYDFMIITSLSTFWDLRKIENYLCKMPTTNCYSGVVGFHEWIRFAWGLNITLSYDVCLLMIDKFQPTNENNIDVELAIFLHNNGIGVCNNLRLFTFEQYDNGAAMDDPTIVCAFLEGIDLPKGYYDMNVLENFVDRAIANNIPAYRVRSLINRAEYDRPILALLMKKIYGVE